MPEAPRMRNRGPATLVSSNLATGDERDKEHQYQHDYDPFFQAALSFVHLTLRHTSHEHNLPSQLALSVERLWQN